MKIKTSLALAIGFALSAAQATAEDGFRQHDAHVHGQVEFNIAQDGSELLVEITAPGADVVGFEHAPQSDAEQTALAKANAILAEADQLLTLSSAAQCQIKHTSVTNTLLADDDKHEHEHEHEHHDDHQHDDEHHDHHDHHEEHDGHGSFSVEYRYDCQQIGQLSQLDVHWFNHFSSTQSIQANLLTDKGQNAHQLKPGQSTLSL